MEFLALIRSSPHNTVLAAVAILVFGVITGFLCRLALNFTTRHSDEADERRKRWKATKHNIVLSSDTLGEELEYSSEWEANARGMLLFRQQFMPKCRKTQIKAVIGLCHGFGDHSNHFMFELALKLCRSGFVVLAMDAEGHGLSDGLHAHVDDLQHIAKDFSDFFLEVLEDQANLQKLPFFVYGVSMGGAVAFNLCTKHAIAPKITGVILSAPMVKVAEEMKPPERVISILRLVAMVIPLAPVAPVPDILDQCFKRAEIRVLARKDPLFYRKKPRLGTALAMLVATEDIAERMSELAHPVLILHGGRDIVTASKSSQQLFDKCCSKDKKFNLYPGCWHDLLTGEPEEQIDVIFKDIICWIKDRC